MKAAQVVTFLLIAADSILAQTPGSVARKMLGSKATLLNYLREDLRMRYAHEWCAGARPHSRIVGNPAKLVLAGVEYPPLSLHCSAQEFA